ncbi:hypothetical protein AB0425_17755 [Actinosynnema sp. NPDC051121]
MSTVFRIDSRDQDSASDHVSRYGAYLRQHHGRFRGYDGSSMTQDPAEFAAAAFEVAIGPIMSPGYVVVDRRVVDVAVHWDDDRRAAIAVTFVSVLPEGVASILGRRWAGWHRDTWGGEPRWSEHHDNDLLVAQPTLQTRVPLPVDYLPKPIYRAGTPDLRTAQHAVRVIADELNTRLTPVLDALVAAGVR